MPMRNAGSVDQGGVLVQGNPLQRALLAAGAERVCRAFPCRAESPGEGQCPAVSSGNRSAARGACAVPRAIGWASALLSSRGGVMPRRPVQFFDPTVGPLAKYYRLRDRLRASARRFGRCEQTPKPPGQNLNSLHLVDEVDGPPLEGEVFLGAEGIAGKKYDWQIHAGLPQLSQQIDARNIGQAPVEKDDVRLGGDTERINQRCAIGKATDHKSVIRQLIGNCLATIRVVFHVEDLDEVPPLSSYLLVYSSRSSLVYHRVETLFAGPLFCESCAPRPPLRHGGLGTRCVAWLLHQHL